MFEETFYAWKSFIWALFIGVLLAILSSGYIGLSSKGVSAHPFHQGWIAPYLASDTWTAPTARTLQAATSALPFQHWGY